MEELILMCSECGTYFEAELSMLASSEEENGGDLLLCFRCTFENAFSVLKDDPAIGQIVVYEGGQKKVMKEKS